VGLDDNTAQAVLARGAGDLGTANRERMLREALGNPLALVELPSAWKAAGRRKPGLIRLALPLTALLERAVAGRVADLSPISRDAVLVEAANSVDALSEILAGAAILAGRPVGVEVLVSTAAAGLLRFDETRMSFRHPLVRSAVLESETAGWQRAAHAALAAVLDDEPNCSAWHRAQSIGGPDDDVADELDASHGISLRRGAAATTTLEHIRAPRLGRACPRRATRRR
jgi:hypothetical protein